MAHDDHSFSGLVYESETSSTPLAFAGGHWRLSDDGATLTLDFGSAASYGVREYEVLGPVDHAVVRLPIREKERPDAPVLVLER